jgi:hypothetical protein
MVIPLLVELRSAFRQYTPDVEMLKGSEEITVQFVVSACAPLHGMSARTASATKDKLPLFMSESP